MVGQNGLEDSVRTGHIAMQVYTDYMAEHFIAKVESDHQLATGKSVVTIRWPATRALEVPAVFVTRAELENALGTSTPCGSPPTKRAKRGGSETTLCVSADAVERPPSASASVFEQPLDRPLRVEPVPAADAGPAFEHWGSPRAREPPIRARVPGAHLPHNTVVLYLSKLPYEWTSTHKGVRMPHLIVVLDCNGTTIYDKQIDARIPDPTGKPTDLLALKPNEKNLNPEDLDGKTPYAQAWEELHRLLHGKILVGHDLPQRLAALRLKVRQVQLRDISRFRPFLNDLRGSRS